MVAMVEAMWRGGDDDKTSASDGSRAMAGISDGRMHHHDEESHQIEGMRA